MYGALRIVVHVALVGALTSVHVGCERKSPRASAASLAGLLAVPADATSVIVVQPRRLAASPLWPLAQKRLWAEPTLREPLQAVSEACGFDAPQFDNVIIALGPGTPTPALLVATGAAVRVGGRHQGLTACLSAVTASPVNVVTLRVDGRDVTAWATAATPEIVATIVDEHTIALATDRAWLQAAIGNGPKLGRTGPLRAWLPFVPAEQPVWAVGQPSTPFEGGLARATGGLVGRDPVGFIFWGKPGATQTTWSLGVAMDAASDAQALETYIKSQLPLLGLAFGSAEAGRAMAAISTRRTDAIVWLDAKWPQTILNDLLKSIDSEASLLEDASPVPEPPPAVPRGE